MSSYIIRGLDIYKIYRSSGVETAVLKGISLNIYENEKVVLIGPSGSGKTTLVNILIGNIKPNAGEVFWSSSDKEITKLSQNEMVRIRRDLIGFVNQENYLLPQLSVKENILLSNLFVKQMEGIDEHLQQLVNIMEIDQLMNKKASTLSQGEKKRVNIAASLITQPKVLIADEPVEMLDPVISEIILDLLDTVNDELGTALVMTSHNQSVAQRADRVLELEAGVLSGAHHRDVVLDSLSSTRRLVIDKDNRIRIPDDLHKQLGSPRVLYMTAEKGELRLYSDEDDEGLIHSDLLYECRVCGNIQQQSQCENCGSATLQIDG